MRDFKDDGARQGSVMLICDAPGMDRAIERMLQRAGCEVSRGECGAEALDQIRARHPDVIVLQARARSGAGLGLAQAIAQDPELAGSRLLLLQDSGRPIDRRRAEALGARGFLPMPFGMEALRDEVGRLLAVH